MNEDKLYKLYRIRKEKGYTMEYMSQKLGIGKAHYCLLENKKRRISYDMAVKIAAVFNLKPDDLFYVD